MMPARLSRAMMVAALLGVAIIVLVEHWLGAF
jgi:hypothetical protein